MATSFEGQFQRKDINETVALEPLFRKGKAVSFAGQVHLQCLKYLEENHE